MIERELTQQEMRSLLFTPVKSKAALHAWIAEFLELDIPDVTVDPESNSNPMDMIWELYDRCRRNDLEDVSRILAYAGRESLKTLGAAILELLALFHLDRDVAHMAAIEKQAKKAQSYVKTFLGMPVIRDFVVGDNDRNKEIVKYVSTKTGAICSPAEFRDLPESEQSFYKEHKRYVTIVIASMRGANSDHVTFFCVDGETLIDVPQGRVSAKDLYRNPRDVLSFNDLTKKIEPKQIAKVFSREVDCVYELNFSCGRRFICSGDHPILIEDRYVLAKDLTLGDKAFRRFCTTLSKTELVSIRKIDKRTQVFDFTVADNHNFFADGILSHNCVDEVDLAAPAAYEEAKAIPSPMNGKLPLTLLTSTRKFSFGLVQKEIDDAPKTGLEIRHWNIVDVSEPCPRTRHRPDLPKVDAFFNKETLVTIGKKDFDQLNIAEAKPYKQGKAFSGCLSNCKIFAACRGNLATKQRAPNTPRPGKELASLLKPVAHVQAQFKNLSLDMAKAQLMCWKPSSTGLIYPNFDQSIHTITASRIAEKITGDEYTNLDKAGLIELLKARGTRFVAGMDFGYTHNFAVVTAAIDGDLCFVLDVISVAEIELEQQIEICDGKIRHLNPQIFGDSAAPQSIKTFSKKGFRIKPVEKGPGSVIGGIEVVRGLMRPAIGDPKIFLLKGDAGCELLAKDLSQYHWTIDSAGEPTGIPDDKDDDRADALRYLAMSVYGKSGKITPASKEAAISTQTAPHPNNWMQQAIGDALGVVDMTGQSHSGSSEVDRKGKKGGLFWNI